MFGPVAIKMGFMKVIIFRVDNYKVRKLVQVFSVVVVTSFVSFMVSLFLLVG